MLDEDFTVPRISRILLKGCPPVADTTPATLTAEQSEFYMSGVDLAKKEIEQLRCTYSRFTNSMMMAINLLVSPSNRRYFDITDLIEQFKYDFGEDVLQYDSSDEIEEMMRQKEIAESLGFAGKTIDWLMHTARHVDYMKETLRLYSPHRYLELLGIVDTVLGKEYRPLALLVQHFEVTQPGMHCTALGLKPAVTESGSPVLAKNFDLMTWLQDAVVYRHRSPQDLLPSTSLLLAGFPGAVFSSNGYLAATVNNRFTNNEPKGLKDRNVGRLPATCFIQDRIEECRTVDEVFDRLPKYPLGGSFIITMVDHTGEIGIIEITPKGKISYKHDTDYCAVSNSALFPDIGFHLNSMKHSWSPINRAARLSFENRYVRMMNQVYETIKEKGSVSLDDVFAYFSDKELLPEFEKYRNIPILRGVVPVCNDSALISTLACSVAVLGKDPEFYGVIGRPTPDNFQRLKEL